MFERFTDRARKVLALSNKEALRLNHEYIRPEHILLGLLKEGSGVGVMVLKNHDVDIKKLRLKVKKLVRSRPKMVTMGKLPQTSRAKKVIEYAIKEVRQLDHNYVGTEHILLSLLRENEGIAAQALMNLGLKLEDVRQEVLDMQNIYDDIDCKEKFSKQHDGKSFTYWWDITPGFFEKMDKWEAIKFVKKCKYPAEWKFCYVPIPALKGYLTKERQTTRDKGNWGIRVRNGRVLKGEDLLAFEPGSKTKCKWLFLPVVWLNYNQDDRKARGF